MQARHFTRMAPDDRTQRSLQVAFCLQPVIDIVAAFSAAFLVAFEGATGDSAVGHGYRRSIWPSGRHGQDLLGSSSIWFVHDDFWAFHGRRSDRTHFTDESPGRTVLRQK